jgi:hypothetical protein
VLHRAVAGGEPTADFVRIVREGSHAAAIGDATGFVDYVEALGPRGIGVVGGVIDVVDAEGDWVVETLDEIVRDGYALRQSFRLGVTHVVLHVGFHLPLVGRMGFADVDSQEIGVIFVIVVNLHHVTDVAAKRRSSVAAKNDYKRASAGAFANMEMIGAIESEESSVGSIIADLERAAMHMGQGIAQHAVGVLGAAGHFAQKEKNDEQKDQENPNCPFPEECHCKLFCSLNNMCARNFA